MGYNLRRKVVLLTVPGLAGAGAAVAGAVAGWPDPRRLLASRDYLHDVGMAWLALGVAGVLIFRVRASLFVLQGPLQAGLAWATKILTDPFHDVMLYWRSPLHLLRGELLDPMHHVKSDRR